MLYVVISVVPVVIPVIPVVHVVVSVVIPVEPVKPVVIPVLIPAHYTLLCTVLYTTSTQCSVQYFAHQDTRNIKNKVKVLMKSKKNYDKLKSNFHSWNNSPGCFECLTENSVWKGQ